MKRRWRLLPETDALGWAPYAWLVYLAFYLAEPFMRLRQGTLSAAAGAAVLTGLVVFVVTYFRAHWLRGRALLVAIGVHCILGMALAPITWGASVFFVYGASFAGNLDSSRTSTRTILTVGALASLTFWLIDAPLRHSLPGVAVSLMVGFVNLHYAEERRATARLRLAHAQIEQLATVAERERIARDLHDVLGHTLSLIVLKSELASKLIERDPVKAVAEIRDVEAVSRNALREVRNAIRGYRTSFVEEVAHARALLQAASIRATVTVDAALLSPVQAEVLAMVLREAATNITRHASASECRIQLHAVDGALVLDVEDDGHGGDAPEGAGLRGIRERVAAIGGQVERGTAVRLKGWRLTVRVPEERLLAANLA